MADRPTRSLGRLVCIALGVATAAAACGGGEGSETTEAETGAVIALTEVLEFWPQAIVKGRLTEQGGCLLIGEYVAVFPHGTGWSSPWVTFADGDRSRMDSRLRMVGGTFALDGLTHEGNPALPVSRVKACATRTGATHYALAAPSSAG